MLDSTQKIRRILDSLSRISDSKSLISRLPSTWGMYDFVCSFWLWGSFVWPGFYILCLNSFLLRIGSPWWWSSPWWRHFVLRWSSRAIRYNTRGARLIRNKNTGTQLFTPIPRQDPGKKVGIGHFRVPKTLTAKVLWKLVLFAWENSEMDYYAKPWLFSLSLIACLMFCFILSGWGASRWIWSSSASKKLINEHCILRFYNPLPLKLFCKSITVWCYRYIFVISFCTSEYSGISENKQN